MDDCSTSSEDVTVGSVISEASAVTTSNGSVKLLLTDALSTEIHTSSGDVDLTLPKGGAEVLHITSSGNLFTDCAPLGYFLGGLLVDRVFESILAIQENGSALVRLFGSGKGSGAAFLFAILWLAGIGVCMVFRADRHIWNIEPNTVQQK